ncbi:hypothetical protein [Haladaptatus sp. DYF46]|nr:hypothetical protein [Haladaptatus sp. DYF46]
MSPGRRLSRRVTGGRFSPENAVSRREESAPSPPFSAVVLRAGL